MGNFSFATNHILNAFKNKFCSIKLTSSFASLFSWLSLCSQMMCN